MFQKTLSLELPENTDHPLCGPPQNNTEIKRNKVKEITTKDLTYWLSGIDHSCLGNLSRIRVQGI